MKTNLTINPWLTLLASCTISLSSSTVFAQGSLTPPPGPPAPTMKSLDQIEARTPISSAPYTISVSGSYYLTGNLTVSTGDAITIAANNVTLDLNGFSITSTRATAATDKAILLNGTRKNIAISNGHIESGVTNIGGSYSGSGFGYGIYYSGSTSNVRVRDVSVAGVLYHGIYINTGSSTIVASCTVGVAGSFGIVADSVSDSAANDCGNYAIYAITALNCKGYSHGGTGVQATTASNCTGYSFSGTGVDASNASNCNANSSYGTSLSAANASNCYGSGGGSGSGIQATTALNCYGSSESGTGVSCHTASNCYGYSNSGTGLSANVANTCGASGFNGTAIQATIGIGCYASLGTLNITNKYNMP